MAKYTVFLALVACALIMVAECAPGPECGCVCKKNLKPVCGKTSDGDVQQFGNECLLRCENTCYSKSYQEVDLLECKK